MKSLARKNRNSGVAMLPMILGLSFIILVVALSLATFSFVESTIEAGQKRADDAFFVASGGISDAIIKLTRDKNYASDGYDMPLGSGTAHVVVERNLPAAGQSRITATGTVSDSKRIIQVIVNISTYGKVTTASWNEL